jgi:hypothetical protein
MTSHPRFSRVPGSRESATTARTRIWKRLHVLLGTLGIAVMGSGACAPVDASSLQEGLENRVNAVRAALASEGTQPSASMADRLAQGWSNWSNWYNGWSNW